MRPVSIPDARIWEPEGTTRLARRTIGAPRGHEADVHPIEVLVEEDVPGAPQGLGPQIHVLVGLEDGDLERLIVDGHLWLTFWGGVVPFALTLPGAERADELLAYKVQLGNGQEAILDPADVQLVYRGDLSPP